MFRAGSTRGRHQCDGDHLLHGGERRLVDDSTKPIRTPNRRTTQSVSMPVTIFELYCDQN